MVALFGSECPPLHATLVAALKHTAEFANSTTGITYIEGSVETFESYGDLLVQARRSVGALRRIGLAFGEPLVMQISDLRELIHALWGCMMSGIPFVTIAVPSKYEADNAVFQKLASVAAKLDGRHVLASTANVAPLRALLPCSLSVHDVASLDYSTTSVHELDATEAELAPDDVAFYQLTSGSTGVPKIIPERHAAIISHIRHSIVHCSYRPTDVTLNWLPFDHVREPHLNPGRWAPRKLAQPIAAAALALCRAQPSLYYVYCVMLRAARSNPILAGRAPAHLPPWRHVHWSELCAAADGECHCGPTRLDASYRGARRDALVVA